MATRHSKKIECGKLLPTVNGVAKKPQVLVWHALIRLERIITRTRSPRMLEAGKKVYWFIRVTSWASERRLRTWQVGIEDMAYNVEMS